MKLGYHLPLQKVPLNSCDVKCPSFLMRLCSSGIEKNGENLKMEKLESEPLPTVSQNIEFHCFLSSAAGDQKWARGLLKYDRLPVL